MKILQTGVLCAGFAAMLVGCGDDGKGGDGGGGQINEAREVGAAVEMPFDATPSPMGDAVYFTAMTVETGGVLYKVGTAAGGEPQKLAGGFIAPTSLVVSTDGRTIYVADLGLADEDTPAGSEAPTGVIYSVPASGGDIAAIASTKGYSPRSLDLVAEDGADALYFSGVNPMGGVAGVYRMTTADSKLTAVFEGPELHEPSGVAVASDGTVYVVDAQQAGGTASVMKIDGGAAEFVPNLAVGYPAGLALSLEEDVLLVSGLSRNGGGAAGEDGKPLVAGALVYRIQVDDPTTIETLSMGIAQNTESAGLHRAHAVDNYAWADADAPGHVYLLGTKAKGLP